jgi:maltooligosyltrehalose trehalohydrolase
LVKQLLQIRAKHIAPRLAGMNAMNGTAEAHGARGLEARWTLGDGSRLEMLANLGGAPFHAEIGGETLYGHGHVGEDPWAFKATLRPA